MNTAFPLIINKSHHVANNVYTYKFGRNVDFTDMEISLGRASLFYSWRNITALKGNNSFQIIHPNNTVTNATLTLTIPDGGYEITDLNNYLRWYLIQNGYYLQNTTTNEQIVYCEFRLNASTYSIEFVSYPLPTVATDYILGSGITALPSSTRAPQLVVSNAFGTIIGFANGTYPAVQQTVLTTTSSTLVPVISDVINVLLTLDAVQNPYSPSSFVIHSISPAGTAYGHLITDSPNELSYIPCQSCNRSEITLTFTNQNFLPLEMIDYDITIILFMRKIV